MAYDNTVAIPELVTAGVWRYRSADAHATVAGSDYFSDGRTRGLRIGDVMFVIDEATGACTLHSVIAVDEPDPFNPNDPAASKAATVSSAVLS